MTVDHHPAPWRRPARRRPPAALGVLGTLLVATVAWLIVCSAVVLHPDVSEEVHSADAVFVLGPSDSERVRRARELMDEGVAPTVVYSTPQGSYGAGADAATEEIGKSHCEPSESYEVICFEPDPSTTQGEAMWMRDMAAERGWEDIVVVTMRPHVSRAQLIVERCYDGRTQWAPIDYVDSYWAHPWMTLRAFAYQTAGYLKAWVTPGCETQLPGEPKSI